MRKNVPYVISQIHLEIKELENEMSKTAHLIYELIPEIKELDEKIYEQKYLQNKHPLFSNQYINHLEKQIELEKKKQELFNSYKNSLDYIN